MSQSHFDTHETASGDFARMLQSQGVDPIVAPDHPASGSRAENGELGTHGTTVIALKYEEGVLNLADRRATSTSGIMYEEAEKLLPLDDDTLIAIAGSYAQAAEAARYLRHSFKYYARSQLQELSLEGKLAEISKLLSQNLAGVMQGIGGFLPVISAYDRHGDVGRIFFYDIMGARFESREYGAAGSGAEKIRGTFEYVVRRRGPFHEMDLDDVLHEGLLMLDVAAGLDPATSGLRGVPPMAKTVTAEGVVGVDDARIREIQDELLKDL